MCRIGCNAETYLARIAVLEAKLAKLQGIKRKPAPRTAMPLQAGIKRLYPGYSTPAPAAKKTKRKPK